MLFTNPRGPRWSELPSWRRWGLEGWTGRCPSEGEGRGTGGWVPLHWRCLLTLPELPGGRGGRPASLLCGPGGVPAPASLAVPWARVWCYHCFSCAVRPWPVAETPLGMCSCRQALAFP